jgi:serine/threonine protein kinase
VVLAVNFCREHKIAHRDVKLSNIIFPLGAQDQQAPPTVAPPLPFHSQCKVKLADFGMAGFFGKDGTLRGR